MAILNALDYHDHELSIVITDDTEITELNQQYFNRQGPTNVIAFPMQSETFPDINPDLLGDVVISADTAAREAEDGEIVFDQRMTELLIHGILHLLGYDHETDVEEAKEMETKAEELLHLLNT